MPYTTRDLTLAFRLHAADRVIASDLVESNLERSWFERHFPALALRTGGLVDDVGARTERCEAAIAEALEELPAALSTSEKLDLLHEIVEIATSDRTFRLGEGAILLWASRALRLPDEEFDRFLDAYPEAVGMSAAMLAPMLEG